MSGPLRTGLGRSLHHLEIAVKKYSAAKFSVADPIGVTTDAEILTHFTKNRADIVAVRDRIKTHSDSIENYHQKWIDLISQEFVAELSIKDESKKKVEQNLYESFSTTTPFIEKLTEALDLLTEIDAFIEIYDRKIEFLSEKIKADRIPARTPAPTPTPVESGLKIKRIEPKHFSGNKKDFPEFRDIFTHLVKNKADLSDVEKLLILKTLVDPPADHCIRDYPNTNASFQIAWDSLCKTYGDQNDIIDQLYMDLQNIETSDSDLKSLRHTLESVTCIVRQLEVNGKDINQAHMMITIERKWPENILAKIIDKKEEKGNAWKMNDLLEFLEKLIKRKEKVQHLLANNIDKSDKKPEIFKGLRNDDPYNDIQPEESFTTLALQTIYDSKIHKPCLLCKGAHFSADCPKFPEDKLRVDRLIELGRCERCCSKAHSIDKCDRNLICFKCKQNHHQIRCRRNMKNMFH